MWLQDKDRKQEVEEERENTRVRYINDRGYEIKNADKS